MTDSASAREFSRYLDAIVELTRQQDSQELMRSLLATLSKSVGAGQVRLFALSNPERDTDFNENNIQHALFNDQFDTEFGEHSRRLLSRELTGRAQHIAQLLAPHSEE